MSSERLYYTDSYLVEFDAVVREVERAGDRWKVFLDRTAFYPSSGGQPFDTGTLGGATVTDVVDEENGAIAHLVDRELEKNSRVRGHIDWRRRFAARGRLALRDRAHDAADRLGDDRG